MPVPPTPRPVGPGRLPRYAPSSPLASSEMSQVPDKEAEAELLPQCCLGVLSPGNAGHCQRHLWLSQLGVLLPSSGWEPGMLFNTLWCQGAPTGGDLP